MDEQTQKDAVQIAVDYVARTYGARTPPSPETIAEAVQVIRRNFSYISVAEIREAYRLWAAGEINAGTGAEMYGGEINAANVGKVVSAYCEHRRLALAAYLRARQEADEDRREAERKNRLRKEYEDNFESMLARARASFTDWRDVPLHWFDTCRRRGMIQFEPGEAEEILEDARALADIENEEAKAEAKDPIQFAALVRRAESGDLKSRAKVIARKISVYRKIILK